MSVTAVIMRCRSVIITFLFIAHLPFPTKQTASALPPKLKNFIHPADIARATNPIAEHYLYVDKTKYALNLCQRGGTYFFVRPQRFGKSSFLRTLQKIFEGRKDIFRGTHIYGTNYSWDPYPVLYLDFGETKEMDCNSVMMEKHATQLVQKLTNALAEFKAEYELSNPKESNIIDEFVNILKEVRKKGNSTVVLIDEYDFSVLSNMKNCPAAEKINTIYLEALLSRLKTRAHLIKFAFVTGISKSVFTTLGTSFDLIDITSNPDFHEIAGLTESDLNSHYADHIAQLSENIQKPKDNVTKEIKEWYNGYNFSDRARSSLYNPLSVHSYFREKGALKGYWANKGHAEFLFEQMVKRTYEFSILNLERGVKSSLKGGTSLSTMDPVLLLYDAGYLTIRGLKNGVYELGFPNKEMEEAFFMDIEGAAKNSQNGTALEIYNIGEALANPEPDFDTFMSALNTAIMKLRIRPLFEEWYNWQTMNFIKDADVLTDVERQTSIFTTKFGKCVVDITGHNEHTYFLFEIKFNRRGNSEAWEAVNKSIEWFLEENNKKEKRFRLNLLAAGFTFTPDMKKDALYGYQAKLFAPDGTVLKKYESENLKTKGNNTLFNKDVHYMDYMESSKNGSSNAGVPQIEIRWGGYSKI